MPDQFDSLHHIDVRLERRAFLRLAVAGTTLVSCSRVSRDRPTNLWEGSTSQLAELIRSREASSTEVIDACLRRVEQVNGKINAVVLLREESARQAAADADARLARGDNVGPLHGVPITLKDSIDTESVITTAGTTGRAKFVPSRDATVAQRLKAAGAILIGKTNTPEFTWSYGTDNLVYGRTQNPWSDQQTPGGSSGGAAAIVAAQGVPFDIGSDTGGSIRIPAHFCGVAGIKPTSGRVSRLGTILPINGVLQSLTQLGPIARSVSDLEYVLRIIAGSDMRDPTVVDVPLGDLRSVNLRQLRVAVHTDNGVRAADQAAVQAVAKAARSLEAAGVRITEACPQPLSEVMELEDEIYRADGGTTIRSIIQQSRTELPSAGVRTSASRKPGTGQEVTAILTKWDVWRGRMLEFLENYDAILCPVCALSTVAPGLEDANENYSAFSYVFAYNFTGWPGAVVRADFTPSQLPVGVQIVARPWREDVALALAAEIERGAGGFMPPPRVAQ